MANQPRPADRKNGQNTNQQKRLGLIGVLGVTFVAVLYIQFFSGEPEPTYEASTAEIAAVPPSLAIEIAVKPPTWAPQLDREYPLLDLKSRPIQQIIERYESFTAKPEVPAIVSEPVFAPEPIAISLPVPVPEPEPVAPIEPLLVRAVYATPTRGAALVGEKIVRDGEVLPNGRKLIAASPLGLTTQSPRP